MSLFPLRSQVRFVTWVLPDRYWYRAALAVCRLQGVLSGLLGGNRVLTEAVMLDHWLWDLTAIGSFPVPWVLNGADVVKGTDPKIGSVFCWIHEPLVEFPMRLLLELGGPEGIVIADRGRIVDGGYLVTGLKDRLTAIPADGFALARANRALKEGVSVICLADEYLGGPLQPFVLQLARQVGAQVVFQWAKRRRDGTIEVTIANPPHAYCENAGAVLENLDFLRAAQLRVLAELGLSDREAT